MFFLSKDCLEENYEATWIFTKFVEVLSCFILALQVAGRVDEMLLFSRGLSERDAGLLQVQVDFFFCATIWRLFVRCHLK